MANALIVDAPPTMFDDFAAILEATGYRCSQKSSGSMVRGIRRKDTATYEITHGSTRVDVAMERRLGNRTMFIAVIPTRSSFGRRDDSSDELAEQIVELLVTNGADDSA
tara:strand:+ start:4130 stop:4456 length:327 start_codon:yes stop_codon:yes gene_type:complete